MPPVEGQTQVQAEKLLKDSGLAPKVEKQPSDKVAETHVIHQDPAAGRSAKKDSTVTIVVSSGPDVVVIPTVIGMDVNAAVALVQKAGLVPEIDLRASSVAKGLVSGTDPTQSPVARGSKLRLFVSTGPSGDTGGLCKLKPWICTTKINPNITLLPSFTLPAHP